MVLFGSSASNKDWFAGQVNFPLFLSPPCFIHKLSCSLEKIPLSLGYKSQVSRDPNSCRCHLPSGDYAGKSAVQPAGTATSAIQQRSLNPVPDPLKDWQAVGMPLYSGKKKHRV